MFSDQLIALEPSKQQGIVVCCAHCGLPCEDKLITVNDQAFCCQGCSSVYALLNDHQLCQYYKDGSGNVPDLVNASDLNYLDEVDTQQKFVVFQHADTIQFKFTIPGMHCNACIYLLERLDKFNSKVINSRVDFFNKALQVTVKKYDTALSDIVGLLYQLGYKPDLSLSNNAGVKKAKWSPRAVKIGIAGFCFGNIMMLSFPEYLGLSLDASSLVLKQWFNYISLALSLPVLLYCSSEFFEQSYKAIRSRTLNIDLPITLAIVATFGRSLYELFVYQHAGYFDSMTGIVFLLLVGRYFQDLSYDALTFDRDYQSYFPLAARLVKPDATQSVNITQLKMGDVIELRNAELLPADAVLKSGHVSVDYSFITGESEPVAVLMGDKVYAGAIINGKSAQFELLTSTDNSRLVKLWSIEKKKTVDDHSLTEKINYYFSLGLLLIGAFAFVYQYQINGTEEAFKALTSVLIVACPCILLLATTFANGHLLRVLKNHGMFVKNKITLSELNRLKTIVFDKTGTLTDNKAFSIERHADLSDQALLELAALAHQSVHPLSVAISQVYYQPLPYELSAYQEIQGKGLQGIINGITYKLGSAAYLQVPPVDLDLQESAVYVSVNHVYKGYLKLTHAIRQDANAMLEALQSMDYELYLSSGDVAVNPAIQSSAFKACYVNQAPEDKVQLIQSLQAQGKIVAMAGDGLNDAPALKQANVAIAVADKVSSFFPACDVLLTTEALKRLPDLFKLIHAAQWVVIISFVFSLLYNAIGLYFAITAQLQPLTAAILMPSSSITMLLLTWGMTALLNHRMVKN
jgi:Cu+-exporting ATPase